MQVNIQGVKHGLPQIEKKKFPSLACKVVTDYHYEILIITVQQVTLWLTCHYAIHSCSKECILLVFF